MRTQRLFSCGEWRAIDRPDSRLALKTPKPRAVLFLMAWLALLAGAGCESYQSYSGPRLPPNQIAMLKLVHANASLRVSSIDGSKADLYPGALIQLLPGKHTLSFYPIFEYGRFAGPAAATTITVEAGKTYAAWPEVTPAETAQEAVAPLPERLKSHYVKWSVVIREK